MKVKEGTWPKIIPGSPEPQPKKKKFRISGLVTRNATRTEHGFIFNDHNMSITDYIQKCRTEVAFIQHRIEKKLLYQNNQDFTNMRHFLTEWKNVMFKTIAFWHKNLMRYIRKTEPSFFKGKPLLTTANLKYTAHNTGVRNDQILASLISGQGQYDTISLNPIPTKNPTQGEKVNLRRRNGIKTKSHKIFCPINLEFSLNEFHCYLLNSILLTGRIYEYFGAGDVSTLYFKRALKMVDSFNDSLNCNINKS